MKHFLLLLLFIVSSFSSVARLYVVGNGVGMTWDMVSPQTVEAVGGFYTFDVIEGSRFMVSTGAGGEVFFEANGYGALIDAADVGNILPLERMHRPTVLPWQGNWSVSISSDLKTLKVTTDTPQPETFARLYIRGDMNDWAVDPAWELVTADGSTYWFDTVGSTAIKAGCEFKIGDEGWRDYILGPENSATVVADGKPYRWVEYGLDAKVASDYRGTVRVELDPSDTHSATVTFFPSYVSHPASMEEIRVETPAVYHDLKGIPVENPRPGHVYIVRQGVTTTKILLR